MTIKVLLDSNVLIAASVYFASIENFVTPFKHPFFDEAMRLIGQLKKHIWKRVGLVTATIETEVHSTLQKAILGHVKECQPLASPKEIFDLHSFVHNSCEDRLQKILASLTREPIIPKQRDTWLSKVKQMYDDLVAKARTTDVQDIAYKRAGAASPKLKRTAYDIYLKQVENEFTQLIRLLTKGPSPTDREILAEAAFLSHYYRQRGVTDFFLASFDCAFSPMGSKFSSRIVTDEILKRFGVKCHWPGEIAKEIQLTFK